MTSPGARLIDDHFDGQVNTIAFSQDSSLMAFGGDGGTVQVRSVGLGPRSTVAANKSTVSSLAFSPDGKSLAMADLDEVQVFDVATGVLRWSGPIEASASVNTVAFIPDGTSLVAVTNTVVAVVDVTTQKILSRIDAPQQIAGVDVSADGTLLALAIDQRHGSDHRNAGIAQVWDWAKKSKVFESPPLAAVFAIALSSDTPTSMVAFGCADDSTQTCLLSDPAQPLWIEGGEEDRQAGKEVIGASHIAFGPRGKNVILGDAGGFARVLDAESGIQRTRAEHTGAVTHVALLNNGKWAASTGIDDMLTVFNAEKDGQLYTVSTRETHAMAVSPNSRFIALGHLGSYTVYDNGEGA